MSNSKLYSDETFFSAESESDYIDNYEHDVELQFHADSNRTKQAKKHRKATL